MIPVMANTIVCSPVRSSEAFRIKKAGVASLSTF
jgi:hypothetical protein